jgi:preprotein translocase subunit SecF
MTFFSSGLFWFIEGILATLFILGFRAWMEDRGVPMTWWKCMITAIWILLAGFTIAFVGTSIGEKEMAAALRGGILLGVITILSGVGLWRLLQTGRSTKRK